MSEPTGGYPFKRPAYGIAQLFQNVNAVAPHRSKATDGVLGDQSHASRSSGHNPNARGVVCAGDITHDAAHGADGHQISEAIRLSRDDRVLYVIFNRRIFDGPGGSRPFVWRPYDGLSPHTDHVHVSLRQDARYYDNDRPWAIGDDAMPLNDADKKWLEDTLVGKINQAIRGTVDVVPPGGGAKTSLGQAIVNGIWGTVQRIEQKLDDAIAELKAAAKK